MMIVNKKGTTGPDPTLLNQELRDENVMKDEHGSARDKAFVGNTVRGNGRTRIVAGFVAGCAHVADAAGRDADM